MRTGVLHGLRYATGPHEKARASMRRAARGARGGSGAPPVQNRRCGRNANGDLARERISYEGPERTTPKHAEEPTNLRGAEDMKNRLARTFGQ